MIQILISDDQAIIREGLEMLLRLERDMQVVGLAQDGAQAEEMASAKKPDLVLMDLKMPGVNGVEATRRIHARHPDIKILVLTTYDDDEWLFDAIRAGASGYLLKDTPREKVIEAIRGTMNGKTYLDPGIAGKLLNQVSPENASSTNAISQKLPEREQAVLRLLARGFTNPDIASELHLSEGTVRNHVSAIFAKLDVSDRTQAAIIAIQHGFGK